MSSPRLPLLPPPHRQIPPQLLQADAVGLVAAQDRLDDVRRERGQPQQSADVGAVDAVRVGEVVEAGAFARFELLLSAVDLGQGLDQRAVGLPLGLGLVPLRREHHLPAYPPAKPHRDVRHHGPCSRRTRRPG